VVSSNSSRKKGGRQVVSASSGRSDSRLRAKQGEKNVKRVKKNRRDN